MRYFNLFFLLVCFLGIVWLFEDFLFPFFIFEFNLNEKILFYSAIFCLIFFLFFLLKKKFLFFFQIYKHLLVGIFATLLDLKIFEILIIPFGVHKSISLLIKGFSFFLAMITKYLGNKYWVFEKFERQRGELLKFFIANLIGILIDTGTFYLLFFIFSPPFAISLEIWIKLSIISAAIIAAIWNFTAYKFLVFQK